MRNKELEKNLRNAISGCKPDNIDGILRQCDKQEGDIVNMKNKSKTLLRAACCVAAALVLIAACIFGAGYYRSNQVSTVIGLDVNPSIELKINDNGKVVEAAALNADAEKILDGLELRGTDTNTALHAVIGAMVREGYLNQLANSVLVTVDGKNAQELEKQLMLQINELLDKSISSGAVIGQELIADDRAQQLAQKHGISAGKAQLILQITDKNPLLMADDLAALSINELTVLLSSGKVDDSDINTSGQVSTQAYIGAEKALAAALAHAAVEPLSTSDIEVELDFRHGVIVYEVEFKAVNMEYEYVINAVTGEILSDKQKVEDGDDLISAPAFNAQTARDIALKHAGLTAESITDLDIELEKKNGLDIFEVEFKAGGMEYDYDINAQTGEIILWHSKADDDREQPVVPETVSVTAEEARAAALNHAGLDASEVSDYRSKLDYDDARAVYEIEFVSGGYEYEYEIDAQTGKVASFDKEYHEGEYGNAAAAAITPEEAKATAFADAMLTSGQISDYESELDYQRGRMVYEIEFKSGGKEYEYVIDAQTGAVISGEVEADD